VPVGASSAPPVRLAPTPPDETAAPTFDENAG
jgi:hypothetical protein